MGVILNGKRNYEYLSEFIGATLIQYIPSLAGMVYIERYGDFDTSNYPLVNIMLQSISNEKRDGVSSTNSCTVQIMVLDDTSEKGNGNSSSSKAKILGIIGKIDNLFSKQLNYKLQYNEKVIGSFTSPQIEFTSNKVYNASGVVGGALTIDYSIVEENDNLYEEIIEEMGAKVEVDGRVYFWNELN